jgi:hypothetical protein
MGASNFTYAEASWTQALADWIGAHTRAFAALGGVRLNREEIEFIESLLPTIANTLDFTDIRAINEKTGHPYILLKILLSLYRRLRTLTEYERKGKAQFGGDRQEKINATLPYGFVLHEVTRYAAVTAIRPALKRPNEPSTGAGAQPVAGAPLIGPAPRHLIETTARPFLPHLRHRRRVLQAIAPPICGEWPCQTWSPSIVTPDAR